MRMHPCCVNLLHGGTVFLYCIICLLVRTFAPAVILPKWDISVLMLLTLVPLVIARYLKPDAKFPWVVTILLGGAAFTVLPLCAGLLYGMPVWRMFLIGTAVFGGTAYLYSCTAKCAAKGKLRWISPVVNALLLFLAGQCLQGMF